MQLELTPEPGWNHRNRTQEALEHGRPMAGPVEVVERPILSDEGLDSDAPNAGEEQEG